MGRVSGFYEDYAIPSGLGAGWVDDSQGGGRRRDPGLGYAIPLGLTMGSAT